MIYEMPECVTALSSVENHSASNAFVAILTEKKIDNKITQKTGPTDHKTKT